MRAVGITGSHLFMTQYQRDAVFWILHHWRPDFLHHGDCIGVDHIVAQMADRLGIATISHPPIGRRYRAFHHSTVILPAEPYLVRDEHVAEAAEILIACPLENREITRSGTWATVRYARRLQKPRIIILGEHSPLQI